MTRADTIHVAVTLAILIFGTWAVLHGHGYGT